MWPTALSLRHGRRLNGLTRCRSWLPRLRRWLLAQTSQNRVAYHGRCRRCIDEEIRQEFQFDGEEQQTQRHHQPAAQIVEEGVGCLAAGSFIENARGRNAD